MRKPLRRIDRVAACFPAPRDKAMQKDEEVVGRYLDRFRRLHVILLVPYAVAWVFLPVEWRRYRDRVYFGELSSFGKAKEEQVNQYLQLALPHGLLNIKVATVSTAFMLGTLLTLFFITSSWLLQRNASQKRVRKLAYSTALSLEYTWWIALLTQVVLNGTLEWNMPAVPFGPSLSMLLSICGYQFIARHEWTHASLKTLTRTGLLKYTDDFTTVHGFASLLALQSGRRPTWIQVGSEIISGTYHSFRSLERVIVVVCLSLLFVDCLVAVSRIRAFLQMHRATSTKCIMWLASWPLWLSAIGVFMSVNYLINYPQCTMTDHLPGTNGTLLASTSHKYPIRAPDHLLFTKAFLFGTKEFATSTFETKAVEAKEAFGPATDPLIESKTAFEGKVEGDREGPLLIHADVYLPLSFLERYIERGERAPFTVFTATRYNRATQVMWPFSILPIWGQKAGTGRAAVFSWPLTRGLLRKQVPSVVVDARGSGGSGGVRFVDLDDREVAEVNAVARWAAGGFWTERFLAAGGISYDGMTALKMATHADAAINVTVGLYSPLAPVTDLLQLDGVPCSSFLDDYDSITRSFERRGTPAAHFVRAVLRGLTPFHTAAGFLNVFNRALPAAGFELDLSLRPRSWSMKEQAESKMFITDRIVLQDGRVTPIVNAGLTHADYLALIHKRLPAYYVFGECDSSAFRIGERLEHLYLEHVYHDHDQHLTGDTNTDVPFTRIVYGPWAHGGRRGCLSGGGGSWPCAEDYIYDEFIEFIRRAKNGDRGLRVLRWESIGDTGRWLLSSQPAAPSSSSLLGAAHYGMGDTGSFLAPLVPVRPKRELLATELSNAGEHRAGEQHTGEQATREEPSEKQPSGVLEERTVLPKQVLGWIDPEIAWIRARERFSLARMFRGEYVAKPFLPHCSNLWCSFYHKFRLPGPLLYDFRTHWAMKDFYGLAYDVSDSVTYLSDAFRRVFEHNTHSPSKSCSWCVTHWGRHSLGSALVRGGTVC